MKRLNYQHLLYFWTVAKAGSIKSACETLGLAQPTISGQLALFQKSIGARVFRREGRRLVLTDSGLSVFRYADEIFSIGDELHDWLNGSTAEPQCSLKVGICNNIDRSLALRLLSPALSGKKPPKLLCVTGESDQLLNELQRRKYDMAIVTTATTNTENAAFSHLLATLEISLFAPAAAARKHRKPFPDALRRAPIILPTQDCSLRPALDRWLKINAVEPAIKAEIGDSELAKNVAVAMDGFVFAPSLSEPEMRQRFNLEPIASVDGVTQTIFAVTSQRRIRNAAVAQIIGTDGANSTSRGELEPA